MTKLLRSPALAVAARVLLCAGALALVVYINGYPGPFAMGLLIALSPIPEALHVGLKRGPGGREDSRRAIMPWRIAWFVSVMAVTIAVSGPVHL